jgi:hypothetical protein
VRAWQKQTCQAGCRAIIWTNKQAHGSRCCQVPPHCSRHMAADAVKCHHVAADAAKFYHTAADLTWLLSMRMHPPSTSADFEARCPAATCGQMSKHMAADAPKCHLTAAAAHLAGRDVSNAWPLVAPHADKEASMVQRCCNCLHIAIEQLNLGSPGCCPYGCIHRPHQPCCQRS